MYYRSSISKGYSLTQCNPECSNNNDAPATIFSTTLVRVKLTHVNINWSLIVTVNKYIKYIPNLHVVLASKLGSIGSADHYCACTNI